jgi:hypothetical protein
MASSVRDLTSAAPLAASTPNNKRRPSISTPDVTHVEHLDDEREPW